MDQRCSKCDGKLIPITKLMAKCQNCRSIEKIILDDGETNEKTTVYENTELSRENRISNVKTIESFESDPNRFLNLGQQLSEALKDDLSFVIISIHYIIRKKVFENFDGSDEDYETIIGALNGDSRANEHIILFPNDTVIRMIENNIIEYPDSIERLKRMSFEDRIRFLQGFNLIQSVTGEEDDEELEYLILLSEKATSKLCMNYLDSGVKSFDFEEKCRTLAKTYVYDHSDDSKGKSRKEIAILNHFQDYYELNDKIYEVIDQHGDPSVIIELKQYITRLDKYIESYTKEMKNMLEFFQNGLSQEKFLKKSDEIFKPARDYSILDEDYTPSADYIKHLADKLKRLPRRIKPNWQEGTDIPEEFNTWKKYANIFIELYLELNQIKKDLTVYIKMIYYTNPFKLIEMISKKSGKYLEINGDLHAINNKTRYILKHFNALRSEINIVDLGNQLDAVLDELTEEKE